MRYYVAEYIEAKPAAKSWEMICAAIYSFSTWVAPGIAWQGTKLPDGGPATQSLTKGNLKRMLKIVWLLFAKIWKFGVSLIFLWQKLICTVENLKNWFYGVKLENFSWVLLKRFAFQRGKSGTSSESIEAPWPNWKYFLTGVSLPRSTEGHCPLSPSPRLHMCLLRWF